MSGRYEPDELQKSTGPFEDFEENPSPLHYLYNTSSRQVLTDFFLSIGVDWEEGDTPLTKNDIIEKTGLTRRSVIDHLDPLIELGVIDVVEGANYDRYQPAIDNDSYWALFEANNELYKAHLKHQEESVVESDSDSGE